ncbi:MAG: M1 family aminopeptidase [Promethearchaeota archaeon]
MDQIEGFASTQAERHYRPDLSLEPIHQTIKLEFLIENKKAKGYVSTTIKANNKDARTIKFDAIGLDIHNVKCKSSHDLKWSYDGIKIHISWNTPFFKGEERIVDVLYTVKEPVAGMYFSYPDDVYPERPIYVGTDNETELARYWLPCVDHPVVRCTLDLYLTSDKNHTILANGKLIEERIKVNGTKTAHWKLDFPCSSYLITIAVGDFISYEDKMVDVGYGEIPIAYFTTKYYSPEDLKRSFDRTPAFLQWMAEKLGPYPFPKYYQYALPCIGSAMENISLVSWNDFYVVDEIFKKEFAIPGYKWATDDLNIHEMAHSWFGDAIVCHDFAHNWLKESWATYISTVWREEFLQSKEEADYDCYQNAESYINETKKYNRPIVTNIYDSSIDLYDDHLYPGGAIRIHMLRRMVGDEIFWLAVREYVKTYTSKTVETVDFQRMLEKYTGQSLQQFFDQWIYSSSYPQLEAGFSYEEENKLIAINIKQKQVDKAKNIGLFTFNLDIEWEKAENKFERQTVEVKEKEHTFYIPSERKPLQVRLDPDFNLLFSLNFNPGTDMLKRQLIYGNVVGRIIAAKELANKAKLPEIQALFDAYKKENFWGVKVEIIKSLISCPSLSTIEGTLQLLKIESDPRVLNQIFTALKDVRYDKITESLKKFLKRDDIELYQVTATALQVIGSQRKPEQYPFLRDFKPKYDKKSIIRGGQMEAIGALRTKEALEYLLERLPYGKEPENVRRKIILAIADASKWADDGIKDRVIEKLADSIRTETDYFNLFALVNALTSFNDTRVIQYLETIKLKIGHQSHSFIDRKIREITKAKGQKDEIKNLHEKIDNLQTITAKVVTRVDLLEAQLKGK